MEVAEDVRSTLTGSVGRAAKDWLTASAIAAKKGDHKPAKEILMHLGVIERLGETSGPQVTVVVGMAGHPALIPPSQEVIDALVAKRDALEAKQDALKAPQAARTLDGVAPQAGRTIDGVPQPRAARLLAPKPDTPSD